MVSSIEQALLYKQLSPAHRAMLDLHCQTCGAKPREWCEQRAGTICAGRGQVLA